MSGPSQEIRVVGARQLRRELKRAGDDLTQLKAAHTEAAAVVRDFSIGSVPVRTGTLMHSIRSSGTNTKSVVRAGGAKVPYAGPIHWGWPARNIRETAFIADAAKASEPEWTGIFKKALDEALNKIKGAST